MHTTTLEFPHASLVGDYLYVTRFLVQAVTQTVRGSDPIVFTFSLN